MDTLDNLSLIDSHKVITGAEAPSRIGGEATVPQSSTGGNTGGLLTILGFFFNWNSDFYWYSTGS
jgi:hypothetical protein